MKLKGLVLGLTVLLGSLLLGSKQVNASITSLAGQNITVDSDYYAAPIYTDSNCTQYSGSNLSTSINKWKVFSANESVNGNSMSFLSFELGKNQWVKQNDVFVGGVSTVVRSVSGLNFPNISSAYTKGAKLPIYSEPQLKHIVGYLRSDITNWAVTQVAYNGPDQNITYSVDLGKSQWVRTNIDDSSALVIRQIYYFDKNTQLVNEYGKPTQKIVSFNSYLVFDTKNIAGSIYVRLGNNNQWAPLSHAIYQG